MPLKAHRQYFVVKRSQKIQKDSNLKTKKFSTKIKANRTDSVMSQS